MCQFLSAVVLKNGDLKMHPMLDSHSEIIEYFKLPDAHAHHQHFAKVELTPQSSDESWMDVSTWTFRLDEGTKPGWWDDVKEGVEAELRRRADKMILRDGDHGLILEGCWIVGGKAKIREIRSGRIMRLTGKASVSAIWGGTVSEIRGGTVSAIRGGTVSAIWGGTVSAIWGGTVSEIRGGTVSAICGGTVSAIWGGTVSAIWGGTVSAIRGGTVSAIWGGTVSAIWGGTVLSVQKNPYCTLTLGDNARAVLIEKGVLKP